MDKSLHEFGREMSVVMPRFFGLVMKRQAKEFSKEDITMPQMVVLSLLMDRSPCKMSDIAGFLSKTTSAATGIVDRMVRAHLVQRVTDKSDRRIINIVITKKGREVMDGLNKKRHKMIMDMFSKLTPAERSKYLEIVTKLYHILIKEEK